MKAALRVPVARLEAGALRLDARASRYVARVHRLSAGAPLVLFSAGHEADAVVTRAGPDDVEVLVSSPRPAPPAREVTLVQAIGKSDKTDSIVRDATELGATCVVPVTTARTVPRLGERAEARLSRWRAIALDAARQCGRAAPPEICAPEPLAAALARLACARVLLTPGAPSPLAPLVSGRESLMIAVGPEGGFSPEEQRDAEALGWTLARLGAAVLRTETVAAAALGAALVLAEIDPCALPSCRD